MIFSHSKRRAIDAAPNRPTTRQTFRCRGGACPRPGEAKPSRRTPRRPMEQSWMESNLRALSSTLMVLTALAFMHSPVALADDWPQFRGTPQQLGIAGSDLPLKLEPVWTYSLAEGAETTPAIVDGRVFIGGLSGTFAALDLKTGKELWKIEVEEEIKSSALVHGGTVFFGDEYGRLRALDAEKGTEVWTFEAESSVTAPPNLIPGPDGCLVVGSYDNSIYCIDAKTGKSKWRVETEGYVHGSPAISSGHQIVSSGCDGLLRTVDGKTGKESAKLAIGSYVAASPAIDGDELFVGTFDNEVVKVDLAKGEIAWRYKHPKREFPFYSSPAVTDKLVILGGRDKMIHALDRNTGKSHWIHSRRARIDASPVVVSDRVYIADQAGVLLALSLADGKVVWEFQASEAFIGSPAVADGYLVIAAADGTVYAFSGVKTRAKK